MRRADLARLILAAVAGLLAPYIWGELVGLWAVHVFIPLTKLAWSIFASKGQLVVWVNTALKSIVFGTLFGFGLWVLGRNMLARVVGLFTVGFLVTFFGFALLAGTATDTERLALVTITAPSVLLLLAATAGTCWALPRRKAVAGA